MKLFFYLLCLLFLFVFSFSDPAFSMETAFFELKREPKTTKKQTKRKKSVPLKFQRRSFSYNKDFLVFNEKPVSDIKKGSVLKLHIPYPVIASFTEEFPLYGILIYPFKAVLSGNIKAIKNTNKALINFDEVIMNNEKIEIETFSVFLHGDLKEALFKDIALNFFESLPSVLALALRTQIPQTGIHFINTDLKNKVERLFILEAERKQSFGYLEFNNIKILKIIIK